MPRTDNQKATTAYLSLDLYELLKDFKLNKGLKSDSQAIAVILEQFFAGSTTLEDATSGSVDERLEKVEQTITVMQINWREVRDRLEIIDDVLTRRTKFLIPQVEGDVPSTVNSDVPSTGEGDVPSTVKSDVLGTVESTLEGNVLNLSTNDFFYERFIICGLQGDEVDYWTGEIFSPDIRNAQLYSSQKKSETQAQKLQNDSTYNIKVGIAKYLLAKRLSEDSFPYSLQEILNSWKILEDRKEKRRSTRKKALSASLVT